MEWVERMNRAMDYLEAHLSEDWEPEEISRIMACPYSVFQRSFAPITGVRLSEYLHRHHIIPHRGDERLFWDESNWQPLCKPCHDYKTGMGL